MPIEGHFGRFATKPQETLQSVPKTEMPDTRKTSSTVAKVVPVHRGKTTGSSTCQRAWTEGDKQPEPERVPFLATTGSASDGSDTSLERTRRAWRETKRALIFSIDLERGLTGKQSPSGTPSEDSTGSSGSSASSNDDSHSDAKLVDKVPKVNRRKRKPGTSQTTKLAQLRQCCPWTVPWCLLVVSALQIAIFKLNNAALHQKLIFSPVKQHEIWRFVTYTFLHAGNIHLVLNIIIQILVGFPLETEQGHLRVLFTYFAGVMAGGLGASIFEPSLMVGASAGVYCLLVSHIPHIILNFRSLSYRFYRLAAVLMLCISDIMYSIRHCLTKGNLQPRIGVAAHISGAICGLLIGFVIYKSKVQPESCGMITVFRLLRYLGSLMLVAWIGCTVLYNLDRNHVIEIL